VILIDPKNEPEIEFRDTDGKYSSLRGCDENHMNDE